MLLCERQAERERERIGTRREDRPTNRKREVREIERSLFYVLDACIFMNKNLNKNKYI